LRGHEGQPRQAVVQSCAARRSTFVPWDDDSARFVCNALQPAEVSPRAARDENKAMEIIVPDDQLSQRSDAAARTSGSPPSSPGGSWTSNSESR